MIGWSLVEMWTIEICEEGNWSWYGPQLCLSILVTGTCTHFNKRGYLLQGFCDYLFSLVFEANWKILRSGSRRLQSNQPKTRKNICQLSLPQLGIEHLVFCLAIWDIIPYSKTLFFYFSQAAIKMECIYWKAKISKSNHSKISNIFLPKIPIIWKIPRTQNSPQSTKIFLILNSW